MCKVLKVSKLHYVLVIVVSEFFMFTFVDKIIRCACVNGANVEKVTQTYNICNS
jgi:hypothetical protein